MSISANITRLVNAKAALKTSINAKGGSLTNEKLQDYAAAVDALEPAEFGNRVRFFDYDGTLLKTMYVADGEGATPPTNPSHSGLTFTGWNNDYSEIFGDLDVGAVYTTSSGKTEIDLRTLVDERNYTLNFTITSGTLTVNWGDGASNTISSTGTLAHTYMTRGNYKITIAASSGAVWKPREYFCNGGSSDSEYCTHAVRFAGITEIPSNALKYCHSLQTVMIPDGVTTVGSSAFYRCRSLQFVVIPDSVTSIGSSCFCENYALSGVVWSSSCESVPGSCFYYCRALVWIILPSGVTGFSSSAFYGCNSLSEAVLPNSITTLGESAFSECYSLSRLSLNVDITSLPSSCFYHCYSLRSVVIPSSVTYIGDSCFRYCYGLRAVSLPEGLTTLGQRAFASCYGITKIDLPSTVTRIEYDAFNGAPLSSLTIPAAVTFIGSNAFNNDNTLLDVSVLPTTVPTADNSGIFGNNPNRRITVPAAKLTNYKGATNWSSFADNIFAAD